MLSPAISAPVTSRYPVMRGYGVMAVGEVDVLDRKAVAALLGVTAAAISNYLHQSKPGRRYAAHPFPEPDDHAGRSPIWFAERADEIRAWAAARPGRGVGGGQPSHRRS